MNFGSWRPLWVFAGAFLYGLLNATVNQLKTLGIVTGSAASLATAAPAVLTIVALVVISRRREEQPAALTLPFIRGG